MSFKKIFYGSIVVFTFALTVIVGCGDNDNPAGSGVYTFTTLITPANGGTLSRTPDKARYAAGEVVTLTAIPAEGFIFGNWSGGDLLFTNPSVQVTINSNLTLTANFLYTLNTNVTPQGGGTVQRIPNTAGYSFGTLVTATATPAAGYEFTGWSGASTSTNASTEIIMDGNKTLTANFQPINHTLTTDVIPAGRGMVLRDPDYTSYAHGTEVTLTAVPAGGFTFTGWSGASTSANASVIIIMNSNKTLTANFRQD